MSKIAKNQQLFFVKKSLIIRSYAYICTSIRTKQFVYFADMVKLVDMPDLGSGAARRVGSSPIIRTKSFLETRGFFFGFFFGCCGASKSHLIIEMLRAAALFALSCCAALHKDAATIANTDRRYLH